MPRKQQRKLSSSDSRESLQSYIVDRLLAIIQADVRGVVDWQADNVRIKPSAEITDDTAMLIEEVHLDSRGQVRVQLASKIRALVELHSILSSPSSLPPADPVINLTLHTS